MRNRRRSHAWGIAAEYLCMALLVLKGYSILARRHRNHFGEIDVIAARAKLVVFIEVKARADREEALHSITPAKRQRLLQAARFFIASQPHLAHHDLRFDAMVITSPWNIHHLRDAWRES